MLRVIALAVVAGLSLLGTAQAACPTYNFQITGQFPAQSGTTTDGTGNVWTWGIPAATSAVSNLSLTPQTCGTPPITFDGAGATIFCDTSPCSTAYTVNDTSNALLVNIGGDFGSCGSGSAADDLTAVTFDGVAATLRAKRVSNVNQRFQYVYGLLNPHVGAHTLQVSWPGAHKLRMNAANYGNVTGFGATAVHDHGAGNCGVDTTLTTSLTTTAPNSWVYLGMINSTNSGPTAGAGAVYRGPALDYVSNFDSGGPIATPGAYSMTTNSSGSWQSMSHVAVELKN